MIIALAAGLMLLAQAELPDDPAANLDALKELYAQSCGGRGYAAYDDVCNQISDQMRQAEREARRHPPAAKPAAAPAPSVPVPSPPVPSPPVPSPPAQPTTPAAANGATPKS